MNLQSVFSVPKTVLARRVGDEIVVLDLGGGEYFGLPEIGGRMWELLVEGKSLQDVTDAMVEEFEIDRSTVERDLIGFAGDLCSRGLLVAMPTLAGAVDGGSDA